MRGEQVTASAAAIRAFGEGAARGHVDAAVERAELEADLAAVVLPKLDVWTAVS
ncbi:hypothetical protein [Nocardia bovistercoris]|uniref:Uncharacterized protein n=1 Tax=Nocardia bovistercoris TaxID=2785916 RepID=A0A931ICM7_9NOCA|nr:hypothetical protein [Nocardia bovistercoris]MBH0777707.1 hypothetical protein [Nocardia bovistercoris]